ncbi:hypothetical protein ACHAWF_016295, partial [Thalassiosira exigua]
PISPLPPLLSALRFPPGKPSAVAGLSSTETQLQKNTMSTRFSAITSISLFSVFTLAAKSGLNGFPCAFVTHRVSKRNHRTFTGDEEQHEPPLRTLISRPLSRPQTHTRLASSTTRGSNAPNAQHRSYNVLYQKVLRAPKSSSHAFLLDLVTYLQGVYKLPDDLPMPYEITIPDGHEDIPSGDRAVLIIDSPLSSQPHEACLEVEVIGIYPDNSDVQVGPTMAMVALKRLKDQNNGGGAGSGVTQALFAASEKRIMQTLDRGLQDLEEGRVSVPQSFITEDSKSEKFSDETDGVDAVLKRIGYKNAIEAATSTTKGNENPQKMDTKRPISIERDGLGNVIIDSVASPVTLSKNEKLKGTEESPSQTTDHRSPKIMQPKRPSEKQLQRQQMEGNEDYAIKMARQQAEALMTTVSAGNSTSSIKGTVAISGGESEFAIMAAKKAAMRLATKVQTKNVIENKESIKGQEKQNEDIPTIPTKVTKGKVQDLSSDEMFMKLSEISTKAKKKSWKSTISRMKKEIANDRSSKSIGSTGHSSSNDNKRADIRNILDTGTGADHRVKSDDEIRNDVMKIAKENEQIQKEFRAATDMMPLEMEGEEGLSPEELLEQILKFGDEKEKEEKPGHGFVEGAFKMAKDLTNKNSELDSMKELGVKEGDSVAVDQIKRKAEEDQLKRIFAAGQSLAENKMSKPTSRYSNLSKQSISDEDIEALIDSDETVPRNARALDDELAELEVRMSRSQGEESEGAPKNALFDVFSGPEVYNPNVDPATAVNWPGAKEGTRTDVKLASDLAIALKQAKFASAVLSEMREEVSKDMKVRYFVGTKEISEERVILLKKCVSEAAKAGIIEDPEIVSVERSRLQMLVDELISQPEERLEEIAMNYKDLLLSDNLIGLIRERLHAMAHRDVDAQRNGREDLFKEEHARERSIMINLAQIAQALVKEAQALGAELEVSMLEIIRSICEVAMDPSHKSEEDTAIALTDAVRDMRPLLDDAFVAYLKYAVAEEEGKLARMGVLDDPEHNRWLFVLKIVQEGVYTELSQGVKRYVDHIFYVLRMKSKSERKELLKRLIDAMPTMDVRPFVKVVDNIVSSLGTTVKGDFADGVVLGEMTNQLLQLQRDVNELLPPERIDELSKDADAWAATQRERLLERRNLTRQRLEAARKTGGIDPDEVIKKPGVEAERFD